MLKLKLQYFGHLMQRTDSFDKTLILGKIEGRRRRGWQRMRWLDDITNSMHEFEPALGDGCKESDMTELLNNNNCKEELSLLHLCVYSIIYSYQYRILFIMFYEVSIIPLFLFLKLIQFYPLGELFGWCLYCCSHPLGLFSYFLAPNFICIFSA